MPVNIPTLTAEQLLPVSGVTLGIAEAGIKKPGRKDVLVMLLAEGTQTAGVFTQNRFCAAPVVVAKQHLSLSAIRALVVNTGNANAGTGEAGMQHAQSTCRAGQVAELFSAASATVFDGRDHGTVAGR